jgi:hypothetical protein
VLQDGSDGTLTRTSLTISVKSNGRMRMTTEVCQSVQAQTDGAVNRQHRPSSEADALVVR